MELIIHLAQYCFEFSEETILTAENLACAPERELGRRGVRSRKKLTSGYGELIIYGYIILLLDIQRGGIGKMNLTAFFIYHLLKSS